MVKYKLKDFARWAKKSRIADWKLCTVFLYGYSKNEIDNLEDSELESLRIFGKELLRMTSAELEQKAKQGFLIKLEELN
jgi:hypothetical protein